MNSRSKFKSINIICSTLIKINTFTPKKTVKSFTTTAIQFERKPPLLKGKKIISEAFEDLTGNLDKDGVHPYEMDLIENVDFVNKILCKMQTDLPKLKAFNNNFISENNHKNRLCFKYQEKFDFDFSKPPRKEYEKVVTLMFKVDDLDLTDKQKHKFILLCEKTFNPLNGVITWKKDGLKDGLTELENAYWLADCFDRVYENVKSDDADYSGLKINYIKFKQPKLNLEFPQEWLPKKGGIE
ncbi:37S ribosomal protein S24, mitochondrial [Clydaea vesicula]|uniref:37S ribosomal protein S24, mitochondrial n=1 Tax=Clydaea vesicula TaxID=447962 RepID=A0AAD5XW28_9FUNG|nr:37S ribosomal protein S24, mitochondrial [Clydaea vesicula]KAJ3390378.1 37S ribosomal protein S24, mitochondrial [Lobulomyces angularis]